jgi:hypothetical protein
MMLSSKWPFTIVNSHFPDLQSLEFEDFLSSTEVFLLRPVVFTIYKTNGKADSSIKTSTDEA